MAAAPAYGCARGSSVSVWGAAALHPHQDSMQINHKWPDYTLEHLFRLVLLCCEQIVENSLQVKPMHVPTRACYRKNRKHSSQLIWLPGRSRSSQRKHFIGQRSQ
jgi:hypothetical protein